MLSLISSGSVQSSVSKYPKADIVFADYQVEIFPNCVQNNLMLYLMKYSLCGFACCSGNLFLMLLLLAGDVELNPGPYGEESEYEN